MQEPRRHSVAGLHSFQDTGQPMELCCCGNGLRETLVAIRVYPCRCETPGKEQRRAPVWGIPDDLPQKQYEERKRANLPLMTDRERSGYVEKW